jgi:hypothetical protein
MPCCQHRLTNNAGFRAYVHNSKGQSDYESLKD